MSKESKKQYLTAIRERYKNAEKEEKKTILNEFCRVCRYNRKYAIRLLNKDPISEGQSNKKRCGRKPVYNKPAIIKFLKTVWVSTNLICSKRLQAIIPLWLPWYQESKGKLLSKKEEQLLLKISAPTIDRLLNKYRRKYNKKGLCTTKPGSILRQLIPVKTEQWDESRPGFIEADTVAHCGGSVSGYYVFTLNIVDIATGWTSQRALWGKGEMGVMIAMRDIENKLPFKILGFDSDNGSEFLNWRLLKYFKQRVQPVRFSRSRAYKKNDNAHIEEKNWTIVRQYLGYERLDKPELVEMMNDLYRKEFYYFVNFFLPSVKLISKKRIGSKIIKIHSSPKTPYQRLLVNLVLTISFIYKILYEKLYCNTFNLLVPYKL